MFRIITYLYLLLLAFNYMVEMEERRKKVGKIVSADVSKPKGKVGKIVSAEILRRSEEENGGKSKGQIESA